jgi:hypothetical protein
MYQKVSSGVFKDIVGVREQMCKMYPDFCAKKEWLSPESPNYSDVSLSRFLFREIMVKVYAWAITDPVVIEEIVKYTKGCGIVEIGAGSGYWAKILSEEGVDIVAYDQSSLNRKGKEFVFLKEYFPVKYGSYEKVVKHSSRALFLCWPPYATPLAYQCVLKYKGDVLIYIGEDGGGCNGNEDFFKHVEKNYTLDKVVGMAQWEGLHDALWVYRRKR